MGASEEKHDELEAFEPAPLENLTVQDALIFSAVYSAQADSEKCEKIRALAEKHPLFTRLGRKTLKLGDEHVQENFGAVGSIEASGGNLTTCGESGFEMHGQGDFPEGYRCPSYENCV